MIRKGESGIVNRQGFIDSVAHDIHTLNSDIRFYTEQLADREILQREYFSQRKLKGWIVMTLDKATWSLRIRQAKRLKKRLVKVQRRASMWL